MQRLEDVDTEGDGEGPVMLEEMCGMRNCTRANRKMRKQGWKLREEMGSSTLVGKQKHGLHAEEG